MSVPRKIAQALTVLLFGGLAAPAQAQFALPFGPVDYQNDLQLFAPVELDFGNEPTGRVDGYFFVYDKLWWTATGERAVVGDPYVQRDVQPVWYDRIRPLNPISNATDPTGWPVDPITGRPINPDTGQPIERPKRRSDIRSTVPLAEAFNWGDRYEFGYMVDNRGWLVGLLDSPQHGQAEFFGFNGGMQEGQGNLRSPLGDVYVAFNYEPGLMHGFVDLVDGEIGVGDGDVLPGDSDGDGILDGDGFADDIDEDGQFGPDGFDVEEPAGVPDSLFIPGNANGVAANNIPDYDDLVELPTSFQTLTVRNTIETDGIELMRVHQLSNRHMMRKYQNNHLEIYYGARFMRLMDKFSVNGTGGVLGDSFWDTRITNNLIGPQIGARWLRQRGRWSTNVQGRFLFGYNRSNWEQHIGIGEDLVPGRLNHPLYLQTQTAQYGRSDNDFSPLIEMRLEANFQMTKAVAFKIGWTGMFVDNIRRASTHIDYTLPNMGFIDGGTDSIIVNGFNGGMEFNY